MRRTRRRAPLPPIAGWSISSPAPWTPRGASPTGDACTANSYASGRAPPFKSSIAFPTTVTSWGSRSRSTRRARPRWTRPHKEASMSNLTLRELVRAVWRRPLWRLPPILVGLAAALWLLHVLPPTYGASTLVMVEKQKVPADYVKATVTTSMEDRIRTIEQQVTNRENLE